MMTLAVGVVYVCSAWHGWLLPVDNGQGGEAIGMQQD